MRSSQFFERQCVVGAFGHILDRVLPWSTNSAGYFTTVGNLCVTLFAGLRVAPDSVRDKVAEVI